MKSRPVVQPAWLSIAAYAGVYGVSRSTVRKWEACGLVESYRVARVIRVKNQPPGADAAAEVRRVTEQPAVSRRRKGL